MTGSLFWLVFPGVVVCAGLGPVDDEKPSTRWEKDIAAFETWDAKNTWPREAVLFVGSSSILAWPTAENFRDLPVLNRGLEGLQTADLLEFMHRIVLKYSPRLIVVSTGDDDIASGKSAEQVLRDYKSFAAPVHEALPRTCIVYLAIKPSPNRWSLWPKMAEANRLIKEYAKRDTRLFFTDGATALLGVDGTPDDRFFLDDKLTLSPEAYRVWTKLLSPIYVIKETDAQSSLAVALIKRGMGPHNLSANRLTEAGVENETPKGRTDAEAPEGVETDLFYVASKTSKIFHKSTCRFAGSMNEKNRQTFSTREQAAASGRRPCQTCKP